MKWWLTGIVAGFLYATAAPVAVAAPVPWSVEFDERVTGDFVTVGNTVTVCPPHHAAVLCHAAEAGVPAGPGSGNNANWMTWADVDGRPETYNSSTARMRLPDGARVRHAVLTWAGSLGDGTGPCSHAPRPPGHAETQPVTMTAEDATTRLRPGRFEIRRDDARRPGLDRWYSAHADVTEVLRDQRGRIDVTVANVWTPRGWGCFGGWSLVVVWEEPTAPPKQVTVYTGHQRVREDRTARVRLRDAEPGSTLGVTAFEGDLGLAGDAILAGGRRQTPRPPASAGNAFVSDAEGALNPRHVSNMGVDAKRLRLDPGPGPLEIGLVTRRDHYLVTTLVLSSAAAPAPAPAMVPPLVPAPPPAAPVPPPPASPPPASPPPASPPPAAPPSRVRPPAPVPPVRAVVVAAERKRTGPLAAPARTGAVIAALGVFAMTVTVSALNGVRRG